MDVDIDFLDRSAALSLFKHIIAARYKDGELIQHNTGVYFHEVPHNPVTRLSMIDYREAEERGYFKIDFLNVGVYEGIRDEEHLVALMNTEPIWELLQEDEFVDQLFHISGYGSLMRRMKPDSIEKLAACLAMIRPSKKHLIGETWDKILNEVWVVPSTSEYYFKKSHSISYAMVIIVQMNFICESLIS